MLSYSLIFLLLEWMIRLVMLPVIAMRHRPTTALAWLAVVFFEPFIGLAFYFILGENRLPRKRISEFALRRQSQTLDLWPLLQEYCVDPFRNEKNRPPQFLPVALGEVPVVRGNHYDLIAQTDTLIEQLIDDINQAKKHIHLLFYIWRDDETGQLVSDALLAAKARGVECKVLVDAVGSRPFLRKKAAELRKQGIEIHAVLPVNLFRSRLGRFDMRNHRKIVIIDGRIGYTGSQNIANADYGTKQIIWHDLMMRLEGPVVLQLQAVFSTDWHAATHQELDREDVFPVPEEAGNCILETFPSGPTYETQNLHRLIVAAIYHATEEIIITTPYFVPDESLLQAFEVARLRGVRIVLVVPEQFDQILVSAAQRSYYQALLEQGVEIHLFQPGLLHSKTLTIDKKFALVGTSNMDIRSFALNLELNLIMFGNEGTQPILKQQHLYLKETRPLQLAVWKQRPLWKQIVESLARLLSPIL
ncbi:MAG: cardiolipin synthase [Planctomycetaceae bacterium]|nr:cardiolipin synthase [Planctomycetaceae bacterium]